MWDWHKGQLWLEWTLCCMWAWPGRKSNHLLILVNASGYNIVVTTGAWWPLTQITCYYSVQVWQTRPREVPGAQVSHSGLWRVRTRHRQLLLSQVSVLGSLAAHNLLSRSLSGCPRANKPKSRHKDGAESEPLRWESLLSVVDVLVWLAGVPYQAVTALVTPLASSCLTAGQN